MLCFDLLCGSNDAHRLINKMRSLVSIGIWLQDKKEREREVEKWKSHGIEMKRLNNRLMPLSSLNLWI